VIVTRDKKTIAFDTRKEVDFVIIGSGASGGVMAKELSVAGFDVVVLEQGPYREAGDFSHDELSVQFMGEMTGHPSWSDPQTFRRTAAEKATVQAEGPPTALYARGVGGSSVHFTANYWRLRPLDFNERSQLGEISGTGFADWPISYAELEPYYSRVDWEIGVSGAPGPFDPPRSRPYPVPPLPVTSAGVLLEKGARKLGWHPQPAPMAILSQPHNNRPACMHCGFCMGYGCEANAKSSTLAAMIPLAEASGRCEIRPLSTVFRIETDAQGRVSEVAYLDAAGVQHAQKARAVIVAANGAETPRLLLMSESSRYPQGLANGSGLVGKYLMPNGHSLTQAIFDEPLNEYKSVQVTRIVHDFYENDPQRGFYGGGGIDARAFIQATPVLFAENGLPPGSPRWGKQHKDLLRHTFTRRMAMLTSSTTLAQETNNITLDPDLKDAAGRPALRVTYQDNENDLALIRFMQDRAVEILEAAGAKTIWRDPVVSETVFAHLLGTCRMGNDPTASVVDAFHRSHEVPNLFICDGSSMVTSGRGQPTMTIQALAFRAAEHIAGFARRGEI
jgi:choline dehydrogenase-like flavoprotein